MFPNAKEQEKMKNEIEEIEAYYPISVFEQSRLRNEADRQFSKIKLNKDRNVHTIAGSVLDEGEEIEITWDCNGEALMGKYSVPEFDLIL